MLKSLEQLHIEAMVRRRHEKAMENTYSDTEAKWCGYYRPLGYAEYQNKRAEEVRAMFTELNSQFKKSA